MFEPLIHFLESNDFNFNLTDLHKANINVSEKNGFYIYNYNQTVLVPRDDPIIKLCRGLVLDSNGFLMNFPFRRFFNYHEKECDKVDISKSFILEKTDGSLCCLWWDDKEEKWEVTTRGSFYGKETKGTNFKKIFKRLFNQFDKLDNKLCYQFETISKENPIVTHYKRERVVLIGARNLKTNKELNQYELDQIGLDLSVNRPKKFTATNILECRKLFDGMKDDEEGLVVVDMNSNRFKLKQESYLKMARIISLKDQDLLDHILGGELDADFDELPEVKERLNQIEKLYDNTLTHINKVFNNLKKYTDKKEFASHAINYKFSSVLFCMFTGKPIKITYKRLLEFTDEIINTNEKKLVILKGVPSSGKSSWVKENDLERFTISPDLIRLNFCSPSPHISQKFNKRVWELVFEFLETRMKENSFTILDATNLGSLDKYESLCEEYGFKLFVKEFKLSLEETLRRNKSREEYKQVPEKVIEEMYRKI